VAGTKDRANQAHWLAGIAITADGHGVRLSFRAAHEMIGPFAILALLLAKSLDEFRDGRAPRLVERRDVVGSFPIAISEADGVTERIHFPFAFMHAGYWIMSDMSHNFMASFQRGQSSGL